MRIMYKDDHGVVVAMECSSVAAIVDSDSGDDRWAIVATEMGRQRNTIIRANLSHEEANGIMWNLFRREKDIHMIGNAICP